MQDFERVFDHFVATRSYRVNIFQHMQHNIHHNSLLLLSVHLNSLFGSPRNSLVKINHESTKLMWWMRSKSSKALL